MENKISQFQVINKVDHFEAKYITCADCKMWLTPTVYIRQDGSYCCSHCLPKEKKTSTRDKFLETMLTKWKYPCMYEDCDYVKNLTGIHKHMNAAPVHKTIKCPFCSTDNLAELTIVEHLLEYHESVVSKITIEEPLAELNFTPPLLGEQVNVISYKGNTFVVLARNFAFAIGKQSVDADFKSTCDKFMIQYQFEEFESRIRGYTVRLQELFSDNMHLLCMPQPLLENDSTLKLNVFFNDYEEYRIVMRECDICMNKFTNEVYFCQNYHGVCKSCISKIYKCANCGTPVNRTMIDLKRHLSQVPFPCPNSTSDADGGCIALVRLADLDPHLARCLHAKIKCICCKTDVARYNIAKHIEEKFVLYRNFHVFHAKVVDGIVTPFCSYIRYQQKLLYFVVSTNVNATTKSRALEKKQSVFFYVQLLYDDLNVHQNYRYEVDLLEEGGKLLHSVGNLCQQMENTDTSTSINWNFCKNALHMRYAEDGAKNEENGEEVVKFRLCIYDVSKMCK
ncbi:uncharacterized protein [Atheta coriaria]|uniref:uncharacterized protein n=1 Tax=Dalotia coriaria TaxID=877792 RepID=UPI0031F44C60